MTTVVEFTPIQNRDAYHVIRGYVYQVDLTIERWLQLGPNRLLELECGEDIDEVSFALESRQESRLLEQVKHREARLTLRSSEALRALAHAVETRHQNPELNLVFRYTTNTDVTCESPPILEHRIPAIHAWEDIRTCQLVGPQQTKTLKTLLGFIRVAPSPPGVRENTWGAFMAFAGSATTHELFDLVKSFEWSYGVTSAQQMQPKILRLLTETGRADGSQDANTKYQRLFLHVFKLLCQQHTKRLTAEELEIHLALPTLEAEDRERLSYIRGMLASLEARLSQVEATTRANAQGIEQIQANLDAIAKEHGVYARIEYKWADPVLDVPPLVTHAIKRDKIVSEIQATMNDHAWVALQGTMGTGKTQLAVLVATQTDKCKAWIPLRGQTDETVCTYLDRALEIASGQTLAGTVTTRYRMACDTLHPGDMIVLDDLPRFSHESGFSGRLLALLRECTSLGLRIISTSVDIFPIGFRQACGDNLVLVDAPLFSEAEVKDVLHSYDADAEKAKQWAGSVYLLSTGHPMLVTALARHLRKADWQLRSLDAFDALFTKREYAYAVKKETVQRLIDTVEDPDSRELLYRLNLVVGPFDAQDLKAVALVDPPVSKPLERLSMLEGLWIQRGQSDEYTVSPLISILGADDVPEEGRKAVCSGMGRRVLAKRRLSLWDASDAVSYFYRAGEFEVALSVLARGLHVLWQQETPTEDALLGVLLWGMPLPPSVDLTLRIFVRSLQVGVNRKMGRDTTSGAVDLACLVDSCEPQQCWALPLAALELTQSAEIYREHWRKVHKALAMVIAHFPEIEAPGGTKLASVVHTGPEALLWCVTPNIATVDQLRDWTKLLATLPPEALRNAFSIPEADQLCIEISHRVWIEEAKKSENARQWQGVLDCFDELGTKAKELGLDFLWACANRARMIIHAEYLDNLKAAGRIGENTLTAGAQDPRIRALVHEYLGHQYYCEGERHIARGHLEETIAETVEVHPFGRLRSFVYLSDTIGNEDPRRSEQLAQEAVSLAKCGAGIPDLDVARALSELAVAQWLLKDDISAAYDSFDEAAERMFHCRQDAVSWKAMFVRFAHVAVYFRHLASGSEPPVIDGEAYFKPFRSVFFRHGEDALAERFRGDLVWACMQEITSFASAVGNDERAAHWAWQALDSARSVGHTLAIPMLVDVLVPHLLRQDKYAEVLDVALECAYVGAASNKLIQEGNLHLDMQIDMDAVLGPKPSELWTQAEHDSALLGLLTTSFRILTVALDDARLARSHAADVAALCKQLSTSASSPGFWQLSSDVFAAYSAETINARDLVEIGNMAKDQGHDVLTAICYLFTSVMSGYGVRRKAYCQLMAMPYVSHNLKRLPSLYRQIVLPFLQNFWLRQVEHSRFLFSAPKIVERSIKDADRQPEAYRAQYILREAIRGLRMRIRRENVPSWLYEKPPDSKLADDNSKKGS